MENKLNSTPYNFEDDSTKPTEAMIIESGYKQLTGEEIKNKVVGKTIIGDYLRGFKYVAFINKDGTIEGKNNVGSHNFGEWIIDMKDNTLTLQWDSGWDNNTARVYDVNEELHFYDTTTGLWRTTFKEIRVSEN